MRYRLKCRNLRVKNGRFNMVADINKIAIDGEVSWLPLGAYRDRAYNAIQYPFPEFPAASIDLSALIDLSVEAEELQSFISARLNELNITPEVIEHFTDEHGELNWVIS